MILTMNIFKKSQWLASKQLGKIGNSFIEQMRLENSERVGLAESGIGAHRVGLNGAQRLFGYLRPIFDATVKERHTGVDLYMSSK